MVFISISLVSSAIRQCDIIVFISSSWYRWRFSRSVSLRSSASVGIIVDHQRGIIVCISFSWVSSALRLCGIRMSISFSWYYRRCVSVASSCSSASVGIIGVRQPVTIGVSSVVVSLCSSAPGGIIGVRQGGIIVWSASVGLIGVRYGGIIVLISWISSAFVSVASSGSSASYPSSASSLA